MHRAPAASFMVSRSRWHLRVISLLWGLGWVALAQLFTSQPHLTFQIGASLSLFCVGAFALYGWRTSPTGRLRWDGELWHWSCDAGELACQPAVVLDFQRVVLIAVRMTEHRRIYLWLERTAAGGGEWSAIRRALVQPMRASSNGLDAAASAERGR